MLARLRAQFNSPQEDALSKRLQRRQKAYERVYEAVPLLRWLETSFIRQSRLTISQNRIIRNWLCLDAYIALLVSRENYLHRRKRVTTRSSALGFFYLIGGGLTCLGKYILGLGRGSCCGWILKPIRRVTQTECITFRVRFVKFLSVSSSSSLWRRADFLRREFIAVGLPSETQSYTFESPIGVIDSIELIAAQTHRSPF